MKILFLGGTYFQIPPIKYAKEQGHYVITCDYLPENPGHRYADEYHDLNATDNEAVLKLATDLKIDGIVAYASDPCAPTAAYVAEKLGLQGNPYDSVKILQRKDLFRKFLKDNDFFVPESDAFTEKNDAEIFAASVLATKALIVKPSDSSGSKGVSKIESMEQLSQAFDYAKKFSRNDLVVIEEYIEKSIYEMDGDGFVYDGDLKFVCFGNQHNDIDCNHYVPVGISFPYVQENKTQEKARQIVQSILSLLNFKVGAINIEYLTDVDGNVYILEIGPRNGGNLIPEVTKYATGVDMIKYTVDAALGLDCSGLTMKETSGYYSSYIMHSTCDGVIDYFYYSDEIKKCIIEEVRWKNEGDYVQAFNGSDCTVGTQILKFESQDQMLECLDDMHKYQRVVVE